MCVYVWVMFVCMYWRMLFAFQRHISKAFVIHLCDGREKKKKKKKIEEGLMYPISIS
jgi:hypothetical protein